MTDEFRYRRAPRYRTFILTGFVVGAVAGVVLSLTGPDLQKYSSGAQAGYLGALLGLLGGALGGAVAVVAERRSR